MFILLLPDDVNSLKKFIRLRDTAFVFVNKCSKFMPDLTIVIDYIPVFYLLRAKTIAIRLSLEYNEARRLCFLDFFYSLLYKSSYEWQKSLSLRSRSCLPTFPVRIGLTHETTVIDEEIPISWFTDTNLSVHKQRPISTVVSNKAYLPLHRNRLRMIQYIKKRIDVLDVYGRGICVIKDKSEALVPYKYHIACENSMSGPSEKLWDALLSECVVFYLGSLHLVHPYLRRAIIPLPIDCPELAFSIVSNELISFAKYQDLDYSYWRTAKSLIIRLYSFEKLLARIIHYDFIPQETG